MNPDSTNLDFAQSAILSPDAIFRTGISAVGPEGALPLTRDMLAEWPSGDLFGLTMDVGMGWPVDAVMHDGILILTNNGGLRGPDGKPIALGYHSGHYELGMLAEAVARQLTALGMKPFAGHGSDPCDGRTNGTSGMRDSLGWRNSAAAFFNRLVRSMPRRKGVIMVSGCDKAVPAARMVLASTGKNLHLPGLIVLGGVTLESAVGAEDLGKVQSIGARTAHGEITVQHAAEEGCHSCSSPGGSCHFMGSGATGQGEAEALGLTVPHTAWAPSGTPVWLDGAVRSAHAMQWMVKHSFSVEQVLTDAAIRNCMTYHAAIGGSTNSTLHIPAMARAAGLNVPTIQDWVAASQRTPRIVNTLPAGPHPTVRAYFAGGVPEIVYQLAEAGLWDTNCLTVTGQTWAQVIEWWKSSKRRSRFRAGLEWMTGVQPDEVIMPVALARKTPGFGPTMSFLTGNLCPEGSIIKSTAIQPKLLVNGVFDRYCKARVFTSELAAMTAIKSTGADRIKEDEVVVLVGLGILGAGMPEIYQVTAALKNTAALYGVPVFTDARFSGVTTGPCVGHVGPEARAGGPIGVIKDGDIIHFYIDGNRSSGEINLVGIADTVSTDRTPARGAEIIRQRIAAKDWNIEQGPNKSLPDEIRTMGLLATMSGGIWKGAYEDPDALQAVYEAFLAAQANA